MFNQLSLESFFFHIHHTELRILDNFYNFQVHEKLGLSPGNSSIKRACALDKKVSKKNEKSRTRKFKVI